MHKKTTGAGSNAIGIGIIGASLAGLAAAYFFLGPKGKKHQKHAKAWAIKMKGDIVEKLEMVHEVSKPVYHEIIDSVANEYKKGMKAGHDEIDVLAEDLKNHWETISKNSARAIKQDALRSARKVAKKAGL